MKSLQFFSVLMMILIFTILAQAAESSALKDFDAQVLPARRYMRSYCGQIRQVMKTNDEITAQKALQEIQQAGRLWQKLQKQFAKNPPPEYAADAQFDKRLKTMQILFDAMADNVQRKNYPMAFNNCAFACGLFVKMHEENGLVYVSDRLFHLRKALKSAQALHAAGHSLTEVIVEIQRLRDRVYLAPLPPDRSAITTALDDLSRKINYLAQQVSNNNRTVVDQSLTELVKQINDLYARTFQNES